MFEIDGDRITCSGGVAALDMMVALITRDHGYELGAAVSDWFIHTHVREAQGRNAWICVFASVSRTRSCSPFSGLWKATLSIRSLESSSLVSRAFQFASLSGRSVASWAEVFMNITSPCVSIGRANF